MYIEYLSASRVNCYFDCPFKYFLQYHLRLPELNKQTIHTAKGSAVHEALELHVDGKDYEKTLKEYYAKHRVWEMDDRKPNRGFPHPVEKDCNNCPWAQKHGKDIICGIAQRDINTFGGCPRPNFEDDLKLTRDTINKDDSVLSRKILGAEDSFDFKISNFRIHGFIDLITEVNDDTIEVIDYKTGNYAKNGEQAFEDVQMRMYSVAAKKLYPQYEYVLMTLYYLRKNPVTVIFSKEDDLKTIQFLKLAYNKIVNSKNPPRQKSFKCNWCVGYEECGKIRESFIKDGKFEMPEPVIKEKKEDEDGNN